MTRRILASFLGILLGLLALVVVPLGATLASQQRRDFGQAAQSAARSQAAIAEERLGDRADRQDGLLRLTAEAGDGLVLLDSRGRQLATAGRTVSPTLITGMRAGHRPRLADAVVTTATVGEAQHPDGRLILVRDSGPVDRRVHALWVGLAVAALVALALGALSAAALARWIGRPLRDLRAVAVRIGEGEVSTRISEHPGPPEVRAVAAAFNDMAGRIGSLLDSQRIMTLDVSHQLRTPLAALRLRLELLAEDAPDDLRAELRGALREIGRLSRLADGLLAVARAEEVSASPEAIDIADLVSERVDLWNPVAHERGVKLSAQISTASAWATPGHVDQVLDNLIANALDALSAGHGVELSAHTEGRQVVLRVADDGPGMSARSRDNAFARFVSDRSAPSKSGLGLAIVARLVAADHGTATLEQTAGGGLTAGVWLPAAEKGRPAPPARRR